LPLRVTVWFEVPRKPTEPLTPEQEAEAAERYAQWRINVAGLLDRANRWSESVNFAECGQLFGNFQVLTCEADPSHEARALPFTCHLRYCPDCERRHSAELVAKYTPILKTISEQSDNDTWSLKKIELTTPYSLEADSAAADFSTGWEGFERWQQLMVQHLFKHEMTPAEKRRGRIEYKDHGYGSLVAAEFGEDGRKLHFHMIAYMPWLDKYKSSELWTEATNGEAEVTWISAVDYHDVDDSVREVVKYVTKFSQLPPRLVVKLADVLDGARRFRTYGTVRGAEKLEPEPHVCSICASKISIMRVRAYFLAVIERNVAPDELILASARSIFLDLIPGNKAGEPGAKLARDDPAELPGQADLPGFDAAAPPKKPFQYQ